MIFCYCCVPELHKGGVMSIDDFMSLTLPRLNILLKYISRKEIEKPNLEYTLSNVNFAKLQKEARKRLAEKAKEKQDGD